MTLKGFTLRWSYFSLLPSVISANVMLLNLTFSNQPMGYKHTPLQLSLLLHQNNSSLHVPHHMHCYATALQTIVLCQPKNKVLFVNHWTVIKLRSLRNVCSMCYKNEFLSCCVRFHYWSYQPTGAGFVRSLQRYSYKCHIRAWIISKYRLTDSFVYRIGIAYPVQVGF